LLRRDLVLAACGALYRALLLDQLALDAGALVVLLDGIDRAAAHHRAARGAGCKFR